MQKPDRVTPSRELLQRIAEALTFEARYEGAPDMEFLVSPDGTHLEFHLRVGSQTAKIDAPVWMEAGEVSIRLPKGWIASFNVERFLDRTLPHWNN